MEVHFGGFFFGSNLPKSSVRMAQRFFPKNRPGYTAEKENKKEKNMKKRILCLTMAVLMVLSTVFTLASCMGGGGGGTTQACTNHVDNNHDGKCDTPTCGTAVEVKHTDANHDGKCDVAACSKTGLEVKHVDNNGDYKCDVTACGKAIAHTCVDEDPVDAKCDLCGKATGAGEHTCVDEDPYDGECDICGESVVEEECEHIDETPKDGYCDLCGEEIEHECVDKYDEGECYICGKPMSGIIEVIDYPWDNQTLIFQLTDNTNNQQIVSVSRKYLAGENDSTSDTVATAVANRNAAAEVATDIKVKYEFWSDTAEYNWGECIDKIVLANQFGDDTRPDVHINFVYDMVGASLTQCFANLRSTSRGTGETKGLNYFDFVKSDYNELIDDKGYMYEYMSSLTLAPDTKMYVISSDYFIDMVRAFFVIPVSLKLLKDYGASIVAQGADGKIYENGDRDGDKDFDVDDFYAMVKSKEWTYDTLAEFSQTVYMPGEGSDGKIWLGDKQIGFAMAKDGVASSGLLYTTSVEIINKTKNPDGTYTYTYPKDNEKFYEFCDATTILFKKKGICIVSDNFSDYGTTSILAVRERFSKNAILFGDIMLLGALEFKAYQDMRMTENSGFGVVPVPLFSTKHQDKYLTQVHNVGCCGAISAFTKKFAECTAFLDYQSNQSKKILDEYYKYNIEYALSGGSDGTRDMLRYIRENVRSSFDKAMEDALGVFNTAAYENKWHSILMRYEFQINIRTEYSEKYSLKQSILDDLNKAYAGFPD